MTPLEGQTPPAGLRPGQEPAGPVCEVCGRVKLKNAASDPAGLDCDPSWPHSAIWHWRLGYERLKAYAERRGEEERAKALADAGSAEALWIQRASSWLMALRRGDTEEVLQRIEGCL